MIKTVSVENYRGFSRFEMNQLTRINLLVGKNNSGKTSLLEGINLLVSGSNPGSLMSLLSRRGEQMASDQIQNRPIVIEFDVSHLFYGHEVKEGNSFLISATDELDQKLFMDYAIKTVSLQESPILFSSIANEFGIGQRVGLQISLNAGVFPGIPLTGEEFRSIRHDVFNNLVNVINNSSAFSKQVAPQFVTSHSLNMQELISMWNSIAITSEEDDVVQALKILDPDIERIASIGINPFYQINGQSRGGFVIRKRGSESRIPIGSFGDGMWRVLSIVVALSRAKNGYLFIDEIDTGLHYSVMSTMWEIILNTARKLNVQLFASTHSYDCIQSLATLCRKNDDNLSEISVQRIDIGAQKSVQFTESELSLAAERNIEIR